MITFCGSSKTENSTCKVMKRMLLSNPYRVASCVYAWGFLWRYETFHVRFRFIIFLHIYIYISLVLKWKKIFYKRSFDSDQRQMPLIRIEICKSSSSNIFTCRLNSLHVILLLLDNIFIIISTLYIDNTFILTV